MLYSARSKKPSSIEYFLTLIPVMIAVVTILTFMGSSLGNVFSNIVITNTPLPTLTPSPAPPTAPLILSPSGLVTNTLTPTYTWNAVNTANSYTLYVYVMSPQAVLVFSQTTGNAVCVNGVCSLTPLWELRNGDMYEWNVTAYNAIGPSPASNTLGFFVTLSPPPIPPIILNPSGLVTNTLTPTYTWNAVSAADGYTLYIYDMSPQAVLVFSQTTDHSVCVNGVCSFTLPTALTNGEFYEWNVTVYNTGGTSPASNTLGFIESLPPAAPIQLSPSGIYITDNLNPSYSWEPAAGSVVYALAVIDLSNGNLISFKSFNATDICSGNICTVNPNVALNNFGGYGWFVIGIDYGGVGQWSAGQVFIIATKPSAPTLIAPMGTSTSAMPTYSWNQVSSASVYYLQILDSTNATLYGQFVNATCTSEVCSATPAMLLTNGATYTWYILAANAVGFSPYSAPGTFTVTLPIQPTVAPTFQPSRR